MKRVMVFFVLLLSCQVMICGQTKIDIRKVLQEADPWETSGYVSLGWCYVNGYGVPQDYREALRWWSRAAEQGNEVAQVCLEWCYENGYGIPQDDNVASLPPLLLRKLAQGGNYDKHSELVVVGCDYFEEENFTEAVRCFRKAAEGGNPLAQCMLGECYDWGFGVTKDFTKAMHWYRQAAEQEDPMGQFLLGCCYESGGDGVTRNIHTAEYWLRKAAEQGLSMAQYILGILYIRDFQDMEQSLYWLRKAAAQGDKNAIGELEKFEEMQ